MTFEDGIRSAVTSMLCQMYHSSAPVDSLREQKREALERISREGSPALVIWRKLFEYPDSRFLSLLNDSLRIVVHAIDYEHGMVKKQSELRENAKEAARLARRLARLIGNSENLAFLPASLAFSEKTNAAHAWAKGFATMFRARHVGSENYHFVETEFKQSHPDFSDLELGQAMVHLDTSYERFAESLKRFAALAETQAEWKTFSENPHMQTSANHFLCKQLSHCFHRYTDNPRAGPVSELASIILDRDIEEEYVKKIWQRTKSEDQAGAF